MSAVKLSFFLMIFCAVCCFAIPGDPELNECIGYSEQPDLTEETSFIRTVSDNCDQPVFTISHTESGGDITIQATSNEDLFEGWVADREIWSHANWDY